MVSTYDVRLYPLIPVQALDRSVLIVGAASFLSTAQSIIGKNLNIIGRGLIVRTSGNQVVNH